LLRTRFHALSADATFKIYLSKKNVNLDFGLVAKAPGAYGTACGTTQFYIMQVFDLLELTLRIWCRKRESNPRPHHYELEVLDIPRCLCLSLYVYNYWIIKG
jgi:hypothetical protein